MDFLKHYDKKRFRLRYGRYQKLFAVSFLLFLLGAGAEMFLLGAGGRSVSFLSFSAKERFLSLFTGEAVLLLFGFLFGVTLYAPVFQFLSAALRGALSGYVITLSLASQKGFLYCFLIFIFLLLSAQIHFSYSAFCTCVALRLYTDKPLSLRAEERRMFGGSLFHSSYFCSLINLRFLFLYTALFFLALLILCFFCFLFSLALCLF